jgi:hypothetical protein
MVNTKRRRPGSSTSTSKPHSETGKERRGGQSRPQARRPSGTTPKRRGQKQGKVASALQKVNDSAPVRAVGLVLLVAGAVALLVGAYGDLFPPGAACPSTPIAHSDVTLDSPTVTAKQATGLLDDYKRLYSNHDIPGLSDLLAPSLCRYQSGGRPVESRSAALNELKRQFDAQAHDPAHPLPTVDYQLRVLKLELGRNQAKVTGHYAIFGSADRGGTDLLGSGHIIFHMVESADGSLLIDQVVIT